MSRIAFYCVFAAGLLVLLLGGWIGTGYILHGVPPNEEEEALLLKAAAITLVYSGAVMCSAAGTFLLRRRS